MCRSTAPGRPAGFGIQPTAPRADHFGLDRDVVADAKLVQIRELAAFDVPPRQVIQQVTHFEWEEVDELDVTERDTFGFGSTGA